MTANDERVPDLLHRFTPTPLSIGFSLGVDRVRLETNDPEIIEAFRLSELTAEASSAEMSHAESTSQWKLVREEGCTPRLKTLKDISIMVTAELVTLFRGNSTVIVIDRGRHEILGFLSPDVSSDELSSAIMPLLFKWVQRGASLSHLTRPIGE
jgi:hypothetical protein